MTEDQGQQQPEITPKSRRPKSLVLWLLLVPFIIGILIFFSRLALIINLEDLAADTRSFLQAQYQPWPYDEIPPINIAAFFSDIQKEIELLGTPAVPPTVQEGTFWEPPTPEAPIVAQLTETQEGEPPVVIPTNTSSIATPTKTTPSVTPSKVITATQTTRTPTPTLTLIIFPTSTLTPEPEDTKPPAPPTLTPTRTPTPTRTTEPVVITDIVIVTTEVPSRAPVHPIAENNGASFVDPGGQGCVGYFGYRNDNNFEVYIEYGSFNRLSETPIQINPGNELPRNFEVDRVSPAFEVVWNSQGPITWYLDGREAVLQWCNP